MVTGSGVVLAHVGVGLAQALRPTVLEELVSHETMLRAVQLVAPSATGAVKTRWQYQRLNQAPVSPRRWQR